jgi:hypothetical protein
MPAISMTSAAFGYGRPQRAVASSGDKIVDSLTTSLTTYNAASNGSWIKITQTEYDTMTSNVTGTTKAMSTDAIFNLATSGTLFSPGSNVLAGNAAGANCPAIPASNYVYGMKIRTLNTVSSLLVFTNNNTVTQPSSFTQVGSVLPTTSSGSAINYYVLKGNSTINATTAGTMAVHFNGSPQLYAWGGTISGHGVRYNYLATGASVTSNTVLSSTYNGTSSAVALQCLTTATKQWT